MTVVKLRAGSTALDLVPGAGGCIARFVVERNGRRIDLMRPADPASIAAGKGSGASCYPLVPFSNRIAGGRLRAAGRDWTLAPNWPGQRHPMHGDGWAVPWTVERSAGAFAAIVYEHDGSTGWPFRYRARQTFDLSEGRLVATISVASADDRPFPAGVGLHPFFVRDARTEVSFAARSVWLADAETIPTERVPVPSRWDVRAPRRVDDLLVDNCFGGWDGRATVRWPTTGLRLDMTASDSCRHVVFYVPRDRPYFCVEPVSHANNAFALHAQGEGGVGYVELTRGAEVGAVVEFQVSNE